MESGFKSANHVWEETGTIQMIFLSLLQDVRPYDFERLMHFMYYGQVRIPNGDLESLIVTAKSLRIKGLSAPSTQFDHQHQHHQQPTQQQDLLPPPAVILPAPPQERLNKYASIDILISKKLKKVILLKLYDKPAPFEASRLLP